jgi:hypothetical protein
VSFLFTDMQTIVLTLIASREIFLGPIRLLLFLGCVLTPLVEWCSIRADFGPNQSCQHPRPHPPPRPHPRPCPHPRRRPCPRPCPRPGPRPGYVIHPPINNIKGT